jgi:diacylglycerol kinase (ATP)
MHVYSNEGIIKIDMIDFKKLIKSFKYAIEGINYSLNHDQNLVIHFIAALFVILASIFFRINAFEMGILGIMILLVIVTEMINSTMEKMVDLITKEHRVEAKIAKDVSAGMVLITAIGSLVVGFLIFMPHILKLIK